MAETVKLHKVGRPKEFEKWEVLDRAVDAFASKGYEATSIQDLVLVMGINRYSLYEEFGGKHELFLAALDHYHLNRRNRVSAHFSSPGTVHELLRGYFEMIQNDARRGGAYGCMMVNSAVELARDDQDAACRISDHFRKLEEIFYNVLVESKIRGEIKSCKNLVAISRFMLNVSRGLRVMVTYENDQEVFDDIINLALGLLDS